MSSSDEEDQPNARRDVDNDYEDGQWIEGEFFGGTKRQKRHQTKEEQIYGVFADSDSDGGGDKRPPRRGGQGGDAGAGKAYTRPVAFISSGVVGSAPPPPPPPAPAFARATREEDADAPRGGLGLGASAGGGAGLGSRPGLGASTGLGFTSGGFTGATQMEEDELQLPSAFGQRLKEAADTRRREADAKARREAQSAMAGAAGAGARASAATPAAPGAAFEAHTRGIGSKLLEKMGYKAGQGLGRAGTGIAEAIQTKLRPKNMGMGFNEYQEQPKLPSDAPAAVAEAAAASGRGVAGSAAAAAQPKGGWKRRAKEARQKRVYKTAEELLRESEEAQTTADRMTVIDMRGAHARVVTNLERLSEAPAAGDAAVSEALIDATPMPELQHNLRLIVDLAEAEIQMLDRKLRQERDTNVILVREAARLRIEQETHAARVARAQEILDAVSAAAAAGAAGSDVLGSLADAFREVRTQHPEEWAIYRLADVALAHSLQPLAELFAGWSPLEAPAHGVKQLLAWRPLLESTSVHEAIFGDVATADDPFARLFAETALPALRSAIVNQWEPRDPEPLLLCLEAFAPVLPPAIRTTLLDSSVLPKLIAAVDAWDPRTEAVPIHAWLHPWLPLLGDHMVPLNAPIRHKLTTALGAWHPSDASALALLSPWRRVFSDADWEALLSRCILPKLGWALSQLTINPADQRLEPLQWALAWAAAVPARHMATLLEQNFFPKWHAVLHLWLSAAPNFDEVTRWYLGWKGLFPEEVLSHERVRRGFNAALDMMNQAVAGLLGPPPAPPSAGAATPAPLPQQPAPAPLPFEEERGYGGGLSLRELVERFAEDQDVAFLPKPGRTHAGMQVYSFGRVSVVIDAAREALMAQRADGDRAWVPASMEQLLEMHVGRSAARGAPA